MKKLAAMVLILLFASTASAQVISNPSTNARMDGMGVANWQVEDDFNIFINPGQIGNYKNNIYGELGNYTAASSNIAPPSATGGGNSVTNPNQDGISSGSQWGGMNMDVPYGTWGVYLGRPYTSSGPLGMASSALSFLGGPTLTAPSNNRFDLFYGAKGIPLGVYLSYADRSSETKTAATKVTDSASEINLGVGGLIMNNMLDLAINLGLPSMEANDGVTKVQDDAAPSISLLGRLHTAVGGNATLLTTLQLMMEDSSLKATGGVKVDQTSQQVRLDTALNSRPNPDTLVVAGIGIFSTSGETKLKPTGEKNTTSGFAIPVSVSLEHQTFKPVKTRIGLSTSIYNTSECKDTNGSDVCTNGGAADNKITTVQDGTARVSAGLGWAVADNVMIDAVINQDILFSGTYVVSGVAETLSSKLSATYRFK
jgi:hypothetical protein